MITRNLLFRILSAAIYFPLLLMSAYHQPSFRFLMALLCFLAWWEYLGFKLSSETHSEKLRKFLLSFWGSFPVWGLLLDLSFIQIFGLMGFSLQGYFIFQAIKAKGFESIWSRLQYYVFGLLYISALFLGLIFLQDLSGGKEAVWFLLLIVGITDSAAYFVGKAVGSVALFPQFSPTKTREGFWGGVLFALLGGLGFYHLFSYLNFSVPELWVCLLFALFISLLSTFGDLLESMLKRFYQVKDSGGVIPGHGGVLDRFDGVLFSVLPFLLILALLGGFR